MVKRIKNKCEKKKKERRKMALLFTEGQLMLGCSSLQEKRMPNLITGAQFAADVDAFRIDSSDKVSKIISKFFKGHFKRLLNSC